MNDKNQNTNAPEVRRILPVMLKVENLHIHLDERSTSNTYFNGVEDQDEEPDIDIEAMIAAICTKTGLCKDAVVMVLDAQAEYLDSVYGEDAEDEDKLLPPTQAPCCEHSTKYRMCLTLVRNRGSVPANRNRTLRPRWMRRPRSRPKKLRQRKAC